MVLLSVVTMLTIAGREVTHIPSNIAYTLRFNSWSPQCCPGIDGNAGKTKASYIFDLSPALVLDSSREYFAALTAIDISSAIINTGLDFWVSYKLTDSSPPVFVNFERVPLRTHQFCAIWLRNRFSVISDLTPYFDLTYDTVKACFIVTIKGKISPGFALVFSSNLSLLLGYGEGESLFNSAGVYIANFPSSIYRNANTLRVLVDFINASNGDPANKELIYRDSMDYHYEGESCIRFRPQFPQFFPVTKHSISRVAIRLLNDHSEQPISFLSPFTDVSLSIQIKTPSIL